MIIKFLLSTLCGALIGAERESDKKTMGIRSCVLLTTAITCLTEVSLRLSSTGFTLDAVRLPSYILASIGFLGAGIIYKDKIHIYGITTACVLFSLVAIGITCGFGFYDLTTIITFLSYGTLKLRKFTKKEDE